MADIISDKISYLTIIMTVFQFFSIFDVNKSGEMLLNIESFDLKLSTDFIGRNFIYSDEIDSTNKYLQKDSSNLKSGTVLLAEKQMSGKGRKDRSWLSLPEVNLTFSVLIKEKKYIHKNINFINLASSLAVALSIENLFQLRPELKWPNDILINKKKVGGILLESNSRGDKIEAVIVGLGINVNQTSFNGNFRIVPTSVRLELHREVERENLLAEILNNFETLLTKTKEDKDYILNDWRVRCRMIGERIVVEDNETEKYGVFVDIDDDGFLLLRTKKGIEQIHFGDVTLV